MKKILALIILLSLFGQASARIKTTRKGLKVNRSKIESTEVSDTVSGDICHEITIAGFDKPLRSNYETMFVKNGSENRITGIVIECNYTDLSGRQLHQRTLTIPCNIPAGQTRQVRFRSWDTQQSFYYRLSPKPKRSQATPFDVVCIVKSLIIPPIKASANGR